jgi:hypothetical protein
MTARQVLFRSAAREKILRGTALLTEATLTEKPEKAEQPPHGGAGALSMAIGHQVAMEHRWGNRFTLRVPVRLVQRPGSGRMGSVRNVSTSGGFVETTLQCAVLTLLQLEISMPADRRVCDSRVHAFVTRRAPRGLGLEWCDDRNHVVEKLLSLAQADPDLAGDG